jgi:hypothetical protein
MTKSDKELLDRNLFTAEQALLIMRAEILLQVLSDMEAMAAECQNLRWQIAELPYDKASERNKLQINLEHKRKQYTFAKNSLRIHRKNLETAVQKITGN